jgi:PucR family transcriptional regulator, purine catabolism regulatory protein
VVVTVAAVLADRSLALRPVHVPEPDREVRWVATSELPDPAPFFQGGEVLLTTGLQTTGWDGEWQQYVDGLVGAGIVAIGIGTGLTYAKPPKGLVAACRSAGLDLFEVPRRTPFVAVSHRISELLAEQDALAARRALTAQRSLTAAAAQPDGTGAILQALAQFLDGAAVLLSAYGQPVAGPVGKRSADLVDVDLMAEVRALRQRGPRGASTLSNPHGTIVIQPVGIGGRRAAFLAALGRKRFSEGERSSITTAVALLALIGEQERKAAEARRRLRTRAVELVVSGDADTAELVLGIEPGTPGLPGRLRILRASGSPDDTEDAVVTLEEDRIIAARHDGELCAVAPDDRASVVAAGLAEAGLLVGVGKSVASDESTDSYRTAGLALAQATSMTPVVEWERVLDQGPLGLIDPVSARTYATSFLGHLDAEQLDTLRCFLRHHGSRLKVAEELGLHRNTVRNRLAAIAAMLPGSLDDPQIRVSAWIALQSLPAHAD